MKSNNFFLQSLKNVNHGRRQAHKNFLNNINNIFWRHLKFILISPHNQPIIIIIHFFLKKKTLSYLPWWTLNSILMYQLLWNNSEKWNKKETSRFHNQALSEILLIAFFTHTRWERAYGHWVKSVLFFREVRWTKVKIPI